LKKEVKMWRICGILFAAFGICAAAPPHHMLAESSDPDVREFGELINEMVELFERGRWKSLE
jgi:hypothetical protein